MAESSVGDADGMRKRAGDTSSARGGALPYCIRQSAASGLGMYATRDIAEGEVVLEELPFLAAVARLHDGTCCASCLWCNGSAQVSEEASEQDQHCSSQGKEASKAGQAPPFRTCELCGVSSFCSAACQEQALWHPPGICRAYKALAGLGLCPEDTDDVRFLLALRWLKSARIQLPVPVLQMWEQFACDQLATSAGHVELSSGTPRSQRLLQLLHLLAGTVASSSEAGSAAPEGDLLNGGLAGPTLMGLVDVMDRAEEVPAVENSARRAVRLHEALKQCLEPGGGAWKELGPCFEVTETAALLSAHERNTFALTAPHRAGQIQVRGNVMYPTAFLLNHSCYPNLCRFDYLHGPGNVRNAAIQLRAMRDIAKGEELLMSYFPLSWHPQDRQDRVKEDYGFTCTCERCQLESVWLDADGESSGEEGEEGSEGEELDRSSGELDHKEVNGASPVLDALQTSNESNRNVGGGGCAAGEAEGASHGPQGGAIEESGRNGSRERTGEEDRVATNERGGESDASAQAPPGNAEEEDLGHADKRIRIAAEEAEAPSVPPDLKHLLFILKHLCSEDGCKGTISGCLSRASHSPERDHVKSDEGLKCPLYECNTCGKIWTSQEHFVSIEAGLSTQ